MSFVNLLQESENHFLNTIARMKSNGKPLVLFGVGCFGQKTWEFLLRQGVTLDYVSVNYKYIDDNDKTFHDIPIIALEELVERPDRFNYITAFECISEEHESLLNKNGEEVLIFDPSFFGVNTTEYFTVAFCQQNEKIFEQLYNDLADEKSRETMIAFINQRISTKREHYQTVYDPAHYFSRDVFLLQGNEVFIDCGAYIGDSIQAFMREVERQKVAQPQRIIGYEPDIANFTEFVKNTSHMKFCECINKGVWDKDSQLSFRTGRAPSSHVSEDEGDENTVTISLDCIDNMLQGDVATFIKMDIEGAELKALEGASQTIKRHQPLLAISVYHKPEDLITIPQYIKSLSHSYDLYLRAHHPELAFELVLYAVPTHRTLQ